MADKKKRVVKKASAILVRCAYCFKEKPEFMPKIAVRQSGRGDKDEDWSYIGAVCAECRKYLYGKWGYAHPREKNAMRRWKRKMRNKDVVWDHNKGEWIIKERTREGG